MVSEDPPANVVQLVAREDSGAHLRMAAHLIHLIVGELSRLAQNRIRHADLPDVVQDPREADTLDAALVEAELPRHHLAQQTHGLAVLRGIGVSLVEGLGEAEDRRQLRLALHASLAGDCPDRAGHLGAVDDGSVPTECLCRLQRSIGDRDELCRV